MPRKLYPLERRLFEKMLSVPFPGNDILRSQLDHVLVKCADSNGGLCLLATGPIQPVYLRNRVPVEGETQDVDGMPIHLLLHVVDGVVNELEIYREDNGALLAGVDPDSICAFSGE